MERQTLRTYSMFIILMIALTATTACNGLLPQNAAKPSVALSVMPGADGSLTVGQPVTVQIAAVAEGGVSRVELLVDGQLYATLPVTPAASPYITSQIWTPAMMGSHIIQAVAYNADNQASDPGQVIVSVEEAIADAEIIPDNSGSQVAVEEAVQSDTLPQPTATQPAAAVNQWPTVTALVDLNVRTGPGLNFQSVGVMPAGQSTQITGQSTDGNWWEIVYPINSNGRGWVSASSQYSASQNTTGVPVASAAIAPTATPTTPPAPTATAQPPVVVTVEVPVAEAHKPTIYHFSADRYTITAGESVTLSWDLANAQAAYLRHFDIMEGVVAPGSRIVSPAVTTVYTLIATNATGETMVQLTITVVPAAVDDGSDGGDGGSGGGWILPDPGFFITPVAPMPINPDLIIPIYPTPEVELIIPGFLWDLEPLPGAVEPIGP